MTKKIFHSICLAAITVFLVSFALIMEVLYSYFSDVQMRQLHVQAALAARGAEEAGIRYLEGIKDGEYRVTWVDPKGKVLFDNRTSSKEMENHLERKEIADALEHGAGEEKRYSSTMMERQLYAAVRLSDGTVLRLSGSQYTWWSLMLEMIQPILLIVLAAAGISLFLASQLSRRIVQPLNSLNLDEPEASEAYEEIAPLLNRIDSQRKKLRRQEEELLRKKREIEKTEQIRRDFTVNVSHELKTPLQSISGYAELLAAGMVKGEDIPHFSQQIFLESRRMTALVEDITRLSRLDGGAGDMRREDVDLYGLAGTVIQNLSPSAEARGVSLHLEGASASVNGVPALLNAIVFNLCDNAVRYNKEGGNVTVRILPGQGGAALSVSDTGIGIPKEEQSRIFERFYRVDKSHSAAVSGTGLGLSIVKHAALFHNAEIHIESTVGEGTTVTVLFH